MASSFEFKRKSLENVIENLLCHKCKAVPRPIEKQKNQYACLNAHQLCEECKSECDCGSQVGNLPNPLIHQILKDLPIYCRHYKTGCRQMFKQVKELEDHQLDCVYRQVYCPSIFCQNSDGKIIFKDIADHFSSTHGSKSSVNCKGKSIQPNVKCDILIGMDSMAWLTKFSLCNNDFYITGKRENDILYFWIYILGSYFEAKNYAYTLSVTGQNGIKSTFHDHVKPLEEAAKDILSKQSVFMIGFEFAKMLRNENLKWSMDVTIHALKEEVKDKVEESGVEDESD